MSIRDANAVSRTTAEFLRTLQADSVARALVPPAEPGVPRWAWVVLDTAVDEGLEDDEDFIPALYTGHVVSWWAANVESYNAPEQRRITADDTCLVYFAQMRQPQGTEDTVLGLPVAFCAMQTGHRDGVPLFVVPGHFHLDRLSDGSAGAWGDILYREADTWKRLPIGTADKVLTAKTVSGHVVPSWESAASASLNSQNTDGSEVFSNTTDLRFDEATGVRVSQALGISTVSLSRAWVRFGVSGTTVTVIGSGGGAVTVTRITGGLYNVTWDGGVIPTAGFLVSGVSSVGGPVTMTAFGDYGGLFVTVGFYSAGVFDDPIDATVCMIY